MRIRTFIQLRDEANEASDTFKRAIHELETGTASHVKFFTVGVLDELMYDTTSTRPSFPSLDSL